MDERPPPDLRDYRFGQVSPKEPAKPPGGPEKPLTAVDIALGVFAGLTLFYAAIRLLG